MKWITRRNAKVDRVACPWLIRRFIDPEAEFLFVESDAVLKEAELRNAKSFDAPGALYTHREGKCSFEVLIEEYQLQDPALQKMSRIVHGADIEKEVSTTPESAGLLRIAKGFALTVPNDLEKLRLQFPLYDALYESCKG